MRTQYLYEYHPDHLGSTSWVTNGAGMPVQQLSYLPYGEEYISDHMDSYDPIHGKEAWYRKLTLPIKWGNGYVLCRDITYNMITPELVNSISSSTLYFKPVYPTKN